MRLETILLWQTWLCWTKKKSSFEETKKLYPNIKFKFELEKKQRNELAINVKYFQYNQLFIDYATHPRF